MAIRNKITLKEMAIIIGDYQAAFPEWQAVRGDTLVRINRAVGQAIWFDRLRTGAYRPTCRVHVLAAPGEWGGTAVLSHFLDVKFRSITLESHHVMFKYVVNDLNLKLIPKILDSENVANL